MYEMVLVLSEDAWNLEHNRWLKAAQRASCDAVQLDSGVQVVEERKAKKLGNKLRCTFSAEKKNY